MTHILVKWVSIDAWDVYPIRSLVDVEAGRRLIENPAIVDCMAGRVYRVQCAPDVEPDEAFIIGIGECRRVLYLLFLFYATLWDSDVAGDGDIGGGIDVDPTCSPSFMVDIGNGITVPRIMLQKWKAMCPTAPRFARALLRCVFSQEELNGSSLYGRQCNNRPDAIPKPALDKTKVDTIIAYTCSTFGTSDTKVKASLATMLAKGK
ncbi:uncharacterized protein [Dermacentor andersoni]|uniref:uncharacterized protein n=1 Tax=Dermacentor andersoni TaxID=34620 RepID=UPI003B3AB3AB